MRVGILRLSIDLLEISVGTVGIHINNTYKKLKVSTNIEAVARASKIGLL